MASCIQFFIAAAVLTTVLGQNYYIDDATNGTQDYFKIAQAELLYKVKLAEMENDAVNARFFDRLATIEQQQQQVLNETQQVNVTLIPLQALSLIRKYCIQTYDSQFITQQSIKEQSVTCINRAKNSWDDVESVNNAKSYTKLARSYAMNTLPMNLRNCQSYSKNQTMFENCYINYVKTATDYVQYNLIMAESNRKQSIFDMNGVSLKAVQCSYRIEKDVLATISITLQKIDDCVDDLTKKSGSGGKKDARNALN